MIKSSKTTIAGIAAIVAAVANAVVLLFDSDPTTNPDWGLVVAAIMAGVGNLVARDNNVSSEQAGAK